MKRSGMPESILRAAPQGEIPAAKNLSHLVSMGFHGLFVGFDTINPSVVFSSHFLQSN
jgi:hypothetical protein